MSKKQDPTSHAGSAREAVQVVGKRGRFSTRDVIAEMDRRYPGFNWGATVRHEVVMLVKAGRVRIVEQGHVARKRGGFVGHVYELVSQQAESRRRRKTA